MPDSITVLREVLKEKIDALDAAETEQEAAPPVQPSAEPVRRPNGEKYLPRKLAGKSDIERVREFRARRIPVLLSGPPGTGKTALAEAAFSSELYIVTGDEDTGTEDFAGQWAPTGDPNVNVWVDGPLVLAMKSGGVLFIDDATLISPKVLAILYPAMDGRGEITVKSHPVDGKPTVVKAEKGFYVIAAHNPGVHGAILTEALSRRFAAQIWIESDLDLAATLGVPQRMIILTRKLLLERDENDSDLFVPQLSHMIAFRDVAQVMGEEAAAANFLGVVPEGADYEAVHDKMRTVFKKDIKRLSLGGQL